MQESAQPVAVVQATGGTSVWVLDHLYTFKLTGEDTNGAIAVWEGIIPPNAGPPPHVHQDEDELIYVLEGCIEAISAAGTTLVEAGGTIWLPRGTMHTYKNVGDTPARTLALATPAGFEHFLMSVGRPATDRETVPQVTPDDIERLLNAAPAYHLSFMPA